MNEIQEFNPEVKEVYNNSHFPEQGMMRTQTKYSTAVQVIKPRSLNIVTNKCIEEAAIAGDEFYYSWSQGGSIIEGLTVGAALAIARNFGNCAVVTEVEETPTSYIFHGAFIDLETGFNIVRPFRQNKQSPKNKSGKEIYSGERGKDVIFQIGASKAIRNVVLNAVPKWLASKVINKAKENVVGKIEKMGIEKTRELVLKKINALSIDIKRVEFAYGNAKSWDTERLVMLMGAIRSIEDGFESVDTIFPKAEKEAEKQNQIQDESLKNNELEIEHVSIEEKAKETIEENEETIISVESILEELKTIKSTQEIQKFASKYKGFIATLEPALKQPLLKQMNQKELELNKSKK